jgi:hypothetical protein
MNCYESIDKTIRLIYLKGRLSRVEILKTQLVSFEVLHHFLVLYESELDHALFLSMPYHPLEILNS